METYLEALHLWEVVKEDYDIPALPNNPTIVHNKAHKGKKTKKIQAGMFICCCIVNNFHVNGIISKKSILEMRE